jgi:NAD(P)H-hydrate epimerase
VGGAAKSEIEALLKNKTVLAIGPGLGTDAETVELVRELFNEIDLPCVVDADALNAIAGTDVHATKTRILTPHPGEMSRLAGKSTKDVQASRLETAENFARDRNCVVVLKGDRTIIAFPEGETWVNPTGSPAMSTGGTGDILTGMIAGMVAQHPADWKLAVLAAVWLHGRAGEIGGNALGEECLIATDLLKFLPGAMEECRAAV